MIQVSIIIPKQCVVLSSIKRLCKIFDYANWSVANRKKEPAFAVALVGSASNVNLYDSPFTINPHYTLSNHPSQTDWIIIPALAGDMALALKNNEAFIPWLIAQYKTGAAIASLCTGAFLLANTNLVKEKDCLRNWYVSAGFRKEFSQINLVAENIVEQEEAIATSNGAYSFFTQLLQRTTNEEVAKDCAAMFEVSFNRECQSLFSVAKKEGKMERWSAKTNEVPPSFYNKHSSMVLPERLYPSKITLNNSTIWDEEETGTATSTGIHSSGMRSNAVIFKELLRNVIVK